MTKNIFKRILSIASALAIVFTAYPPVIFADDGGLCPHHPEHTAECGYVEGVSPCNFVCEICDPPEASDSTEPSDTPEPEVTTSPEEQPLVTTAPEPEPAETVTTEAMPEESETMPTEPLPEPESSPAEPEIQLMSVNGYHNCNGISDWQAWEIDNSLPTSAGNWYLTQPVTLTGGWTVPEGGVNLCLNGQAVNCGENLVKVENGASLTVYDCQNGEGISGTGSQTVKVEYGGEFTLKSGKIFNNNSYWKAIFVDYSGTVAIEGGTVEAINIAIHGEEASVIKVTDGVIKGGSDSLVSAIESSGTLEISGGNITSDGVGAVQISPGCNFNLSGSPVIGGIRFVGSAVITIDKPLSGGPYSVKLSTGTGEFATGDCAAESVDCFTSADPKYMVKVTSEGNGLELVEWPNHYHDGDPTEFKPWISGDSLPTDPGSYYLTTDVTPTGDWDVPGKVNLCLNGKHIELEDYHIQISSDDALTICDCHPDDINFQISSNFTAICVDGNGIFTLNGGSVIGSDQAIYSDNESAVITINGGIASGMQKAVCAKNVTITGGSIAGVWDTGVDETTSLKLSGNPMILGGSGKPDIYINHEHPMTVRDLTNTDPYGIAMDTPGVFATVDGGSAEDYVDNFYSKDNKYAVVADGDSLKLVEVHRHADGEEFKAWDKNDSLPDTVGNWYLTKNVSISANWDVPAGGVKLCLAGHSVSFDYGRILLNDANLTVYDCGNGEGIISNDDVTVEIEDNSSFTLKSGTINNSKKVGTTVSVSKNGILTIDGGTVESFVNAAYSGWNESSTVININGGEIKGGQSAVSSYGVLNITAGKMTATKNSALLINGTCTLNLSGSPVISGINPDTGKKLDIRLYNGNIHISEKLTGEPYVVGRYGSDRLERVFATGTYAEESIGYFELADDLIAQGYVIVAEDGGLKAVVKHEHEDHTNFDTKWDSETDLPSDDGVYFLTKDVTLAANWDVGSDITLCLNGHKIDCGGNYININGAGSLTVYDCQNGNGITGTGKQTINVDGGKFTLKSGVIKNTVLARCAINVNQSSSATISGGKIVHESGYGIKGAENSTVTINDGEIESLYEGIASKGDVIIRGGSITSTDDSSYAVGLETYGHLTISGNPMLKSNSSADIDLTSNPITVDRELTGENKYRVSAVRQNCAFAVGDFAAQSAAKFTSSNSDYEVQKVGSELWLVPKDAHVHDDGTIFLPWDGSTTLTDGNYYLKNDVSLSYFLETSGDVKLCLNGHKLECVQINVNSGSLTVDDCSEDESGEIVSNAIAIYVSDGSVTINSGKITGASQGILSQNSTSVTVNGGVIKGRSNGIVSYGNLIVAGGTIISESSSGITFMGGTDSQFSLSGSPIIKGNETSGYKASIYYNPIKGEIAIAKPLTGKYTIYLSVSGDSITFAKGAYAAASKDCFTLSEDLKNKGYEIAAVDDTLVARLKTYTIKYEPGEGSGSIDSQTKTHGKNITISSEKFTRSGYTQTGWKTADGDEYAFGANYTENENLTLYPVWEKNKIHFYKNGTEIESLSLKVGESAEISVKITPESAVCDAIKWTAEAGISINPNAGETVTVTGDSAGEFKLTASTDGNLTTKTLTVTVTRYDSTVSADNQTVTYGDDVTITAKVEKSATNGIALMANYDNKVTFKLGDTVLGEAEVKNGEATLTIPATRANGFAIGDNTVILQYNGSGELEHSSRTVTVNVTPKPLNATIAGTTTKTYDGTVSADDLGLKLELSGVVDGDTVGASAEFAFDSAAAGNRTISAENAALTGEHVDYYELSTPIPTVSGTISPLPAKIVWNGDEFAYDGTSHEVTAAVENAVGGDEFKLTYAENTAKNVGNYTAKVTALGNENYTLNGATGIEHEWKITTLSLADAQVEIVGTYTYNCEIQVPKIRVTLGGKELSADKDYTVAYSGEVKDVGKYTVTLTGTGNYSGSASAEFEIAPKSLTARISGTLSKVYDGTANVSNDVKIALTGVIGTDDVKATSEISYDSANVSAGKIVAKNITLSGDDSKNYVLASTQAEVSGSITPAPINLPNTEFIYSGEAKTVIQVSGIDETVTATLTAFSSDAGEYEYSGVAKEGCYTVELSSDNYAVSNAGKLTIKPLVAVIKWQSGEFTYDGTVHEVTATVKNAVAGDKFEIAYTGNAATSAGDYIAKITALGNANYTLEDANEYKWKITPRIAEIEWVGEKYTYDGEPHIVTATVKNAVMGDKFNITYTNNTATEAGNYTAKVTDLGNENYTLSSATGVEHEWKITAASQAAPEVKIDFINETLSTDETMEFSVDGETWQDCTAAMNVAKTGWSGSTMTVKIRYKKDVDHLDGEIQSLVIPARRAAPDISETAVSKSQTEITIAEIPGCEYSLDGVTWQDNSSFSELEKGETYEIHVRYKATASAFASFISQKTVVTSSTADGTTELLPGETVAAGDGSIKNLGGEIIIDDGAGNMTTVTLPDGGSVEVDEQGCVTVPDGGEVAVGDNPAVSLPEGGKVEPDGTVIADEVKVGNTDVKGEDVTVAPDGNITVPGEGQVTVGDNPEIILPTGGTVEPDGTVIADEVKIGNTDVKGEDVTVAPDGNITVPGEGSVKVGDNPEITLPTGGTVEPDGTVIADEVKVGNTEVKGKDVTVAPDENITVPGEGSVKVGYNPEIILPTGGKVEPDGTVTADEVKIGDTDVKGEDVTVAPNGKITLPEGGKVSAEGEPEKIVPAGTTIENGKINAPAIAESVDGEILGDDIILKIEPADERLETADRENLKDMANAIVREVYDIELLKNGVEVQPDKSIKLTVSADVSGAKMKVFMLNNDGKFIEFDAEFDTENGTFSVITDSLGIFILASEEGQITSEVVASGGAPEVEIGDDDRKALEEDVFTDEDEAALENGDNVKVIMNVEGVSEEDISADDLAEIEAFLDDLEGCEVAEYADITLTKITEDGVTGDEIKSEAISEINNPIKLVIDIPETLHKVGRIFSVIRLHDGKAELLNDTDQSDETVTILTDKFSLYVLIYRDPASRPSHVHSFTAWINVGEAGHLARCAICGKVMSLMPHTMLNGVCTVCGYVAVRAPAYLPDDGDVIEIEVPTQGMIANEEVVEF